MDVIVQTHTIPSLGTLTQAKIKKQVRQELDLYFDELICTATNPTFSISADIICRYIVGMATLKTMMCMLLDELDKGTQALYLDAMEARFKFETDVTVEHTNTTKDYQYWHQYVVVDHH